MAKKFTKDKKASIITQTLIDKKSTTDFPVNNFKVSFQYLDTSQKYGSGFKHWQSTGMLSCAMEVLRGFCCRPLMEQADGKKFTIYGDFPPQGSTKFIKPSNIPDDANWARIHITGSSIIAGHVLQDTFYVVFLDQEHNFYLTKRVREKKYQ